MPFNFPEGEILLMDKPLHWTSYDVVRKIKKTIKEITGAIVKVGHAGTLDPLATGLLIVCTGKMTKKISEIQDAEKEYSGLMKLGESTPSFDGETEVDQKFDIYGIEDADIYKMVDKFTGKIKQTPPAYSALKQDGERMYRRSRKGESFIIPPREVNIYDFKITKIDRPIISFIVTCSKGTYIRSLVHEFGIALGSRAYLTSLQRTRIGVYKLENALKIEDFQLLLNGEMAI
jgi:tRNA pseudouridine55 synthase